MLRATVNRLLHVFTGRWVAAERVGPHSGPGHLGEGATRHEDAAVIVEQVARERKVKRSRFGVHCRLVCDAHRRSVISKEDDLFFGTHGSILCPRVNSTKPGGPAAVEINRKYVTPEQGVK